MLGNYEHTYLRKRYARFKILSCLIRRSVSLIKVNEVLPERRFFTHSHTRSTSHRILGKPQYHHVVTHTHTHTHDAMKIHRHSSWVRIFALTCSLPVCNGTKFIRHTKLQPQAWHNEVVWVEFEFWSSKEASRFHLGFLLLTQGVHNVSLPKRKPYFGMWVCAGIAKTDV